MNKTELPKFLEKYRIEQKQLDKEHIKRLKLIDQYKGIKSPPKNVIEAIIRESLQYFSGYVDKLVISKIIYENKKIKDVDITERIVETRSITVNGITYTAYIIGNDNIESHDFLY